MSTTTGMVLLPWKRVCAAEVAEALCVCRGQSANYLTDYNGQVIEREGGEGGGETGSERERKMRLNHIFVFAKLLMLLSHVLFVLILLIKQLMFTQLGIIFALILFLNDTRIYLNCL